MNPDLPESLSQALADGRLLQSSYDNLRELLEKSDNPLYEASIRDLVNQNQWEEINNRFFKKLAFGTGGMRGRSIGTVVTPSEQGSAAADERPEFPCVGTSSLNFYNLTRATIGLVRHLRKNQAPGKKPSLAIARDTRHFGEAFASHVAKVATENGADVYLFSQPRSTPQLSFAIRHLGTSAGVVLTASHNPPHDNGFKVYSSDGSQIVEPDASLIIAEVNAVESENYEPLAEAERGTITGLVDEIDEPYKQRLESLLLDPDLVKSQSDLRIVFTNIHGTGGVISPAMLRRLGFHCDTVPEQDLQDGAFPTVDSPNPENAPALQMGIDLAEATGADIVIGTDPDADRMGVVVRDKNGRMTLLTGNQIGSLIAWYRLHAFTEKGILHEGNRRNATLVKTFVTSELQQSIANEFQVPLVNTLTGFKYISEKLRKYENALPEEIRGQYLHLDVAAARDAQLAHSTFFVFGGEESYGYLGADFVRDKDANGAVVMVAEVAAHAKSRGITLVEMLDELFQKHGVHLEGQHAETLAGADGAAKIQQLAASYLAHPPAELDGVAVVRVRDFANQDHTDEEGDPVPKESMVFVDLEDGRAFAVRPSGTEPKIKFYLYYKPATGGASVTDLAAAKEEANQRYQSLKEAVIADMRQRLDSFRA